MDESLQQILDSLWQAAVPTAVFGGILIWLYIFRCAWRRKHVIPFSPRRPVPWGGLDVLGLLFAYVGLAVLLAYGAEVCLGWDLRGDNQPSLVQNDSSPSETSGNASGEVPDRETGEDADEDLDRAHPVVVLLSSDSGAGTLLLCVFAVVVLAPLAEELVFRLLLQGYFEKVDRRSQRIWRYPGRLFGFVPILMSSFLFAGLHARQPQTPRAAEQLIQLLAVDSVAKVILVIGAIGYLMNLRGATWKDLGLQLDKFWSDAGFAVAAFVAVIVPIYILQATLAKLLPDTVPDPFPLFLLALALGYLYFRTHRLTPAVLLHLLFNATAIGMFYATM